MRYSHQREMVLNIVKGRCDHPTADMIYESCREIEPTISLGTVYRNLKLLSSDGTIDTLETVDKKIHYDGNTNTHIHFICKECGKIIDLFVKPSVPKELEDLGVSVSSEKCVYYGECAECKIKNNN